MNRRKPNLYRSASRPGFTLIELLVVMVIIGILMALILPAISAARRRTQIAVAAAELTALDQAISSFKSRFGVEPPSSLTIPINAAGWTASDRQKVQRVWDQFDFASCGGLGYSGTEVYLNGAECLVFFLGGLNNGTATAPKLIGFSKNPRTPWNAVGENRDVPFYDRFDSDRLVDIDGDGALEFLDPLPGQTKPLLFFSSQGKSYRKSNNATAWDDFDVHGTMANAEDMLSLYVGADGKTPERAQGYQIVSPGIDGVYGPGGIYTDGSELIDFDVDSSGAIDIDELRAAEADNITNFSGGELKK